MSTWSHSGRGWESLEGRGRPCSSGGSGTRSPSGLCGSSCLWRGVRGGPCDPGTPTTFDAQGVPPRPQCRPSLPLGTVRNPDRSSLRSGSLFRFCPCGKGSASSSLSGVAQRARRPFPLSTTHPVFGLERPDRSPGDVGWSQDWLSIPSVFYVHESRNRVLKGRSSVSGALVCTFYGVDLRPYTDSVNVVIRPDLWTPPLDEGVAKGGIEG